ncbi:uncharacterized protein [Venturia canescens]|uniref:uncharacterized protein n=1 Tax=Venturia canescens TaxID=32260 RepID=UPI001C9D100F|nr:uncharacterized protein LOC122409729 [Venturia canescens]
MANISFKHFTTLSLVVTIIYLCKVHSKDATAIRWNRQCPTCGGGAEELLTSPWYGAPRRRVKLYSASRNYRDTKSREPREALSGSGPEEEKKKTANGKIELSEGIFGLGNVNEGKHHERKERSSSTQEFEFEGKKYALVLSNGHSSIEEVEPEASSSSMESMISISPSSIERLFSIYNSVQKYVSMMDPKKTVYENFEQVAVNILRTMIHQQFPQLFENRGPEQGQRTDNWGYGNNEEYNSGGGYADRTLFTRSGRSGQEGFPFSAIGKEILEEFVTRKSEDLQSVKGSQFSGAPRLSGAESIAVPRYEIPPVVMTNLYSDFRNGERPAPRSQPTVQPTDQPTPAKIIKNIEQESTVFRNNGIKLDELMDCYFTPASVAPIRDMGDADANRDLYNQRRVFQRPNQVPTWTYKREIELNDQTPATLDMSLGEPFDSDKNGGPAVRLARSERPPETVETFDQPKEAADLSRSSESKNSENGAITDESSSGTLVNSDNPANVSKSDELIRASVDEILSELFKPEERQMSSAETADTSSILLDKLRNLEQVIARRNETSVPSHIEKVPTIGSA